MMAAQTRSATALPYEYLNVGTGLSPSHRKVIGWLELRIGVPERAILRQ
jgi:hypothetical protein